MYVCMCTNICICCYRNIHISLCIYVLVCVSACVYPQTHTHTNLNLKSNAITLKNIVTKCRLLGWQFFISAIQRCHRIVFWNSLFLMRSQWSFLSLSCLCLSLSLFVCYICFSSATFKISFLWLVMEIHYNGP